MMTKSKFKFHFLVFLFMIGFSFLISTGFAEEGALPPMPSESAADKDSEKIVQTLNETLKENRALRDKAILAEQALDETKTQNNLLANQIRQLQAQMADLERTGKSEQNELARQTSEIKQQIENLEKQKNDFESMRLETEKKNQEIINENKRLQELLSTSILESEKKEYTALLKRTESSAKRAVRAFSGAKKESESLKRKLSNEYYTLGNLFFEKQDYKKAISQFKKALRLNSEDAWSHHNLGVIYDYYLNDNKRALYHYRKYLQIKPLEEGAREIRERILHLGLGKHIVPDYPIRLDFNKYQKDLKTK